MKEHDDRPSGQLEQHEIEEAEELRKVANAILSDLSSEVGEQVLDLVNSGAVIVGPTPLTIGITVAGWNALRRVLVGAGEEPDTEDIETAEQGGRGAEARLLMLQGVIRYITKVIGLADNAQLDDVVLAVERLKKVSGGAGRLPLPVFGSVGTFDVGWSRDIRTSMARKDRIDNAVSKTMKPADLITKALGGRHLYLSSNSSHGPAWRVWHFDDLYVLAGFHSIRVQARTGQDPDAPWVQQATNRLWERLVPHFVAPPLVPAPGHLVKSFDGNHVGVIERLCMQGGLLDRRHTRVVKVDPLTSGGCIRFVPVDDLKVVDAAPENAPTMWVEQPKEPPTPGADQTKDAPRGSKHPDPEAPGCCDELPDGATWFRGL